MSSWLTPDRSMLSFPAADVTIWDALLSCLKNPMNLWSCCENRSWQMIRSCLNCLSNLLPDRESAPESGKWSAKSCYGFRSAHCGSWHWQDRLWRSASPAEVSLPAQPPVSPAVLHESSSARRSILRYRHGYADRCANLSCRRQLQVWSDLYGASHL
jgi:hypothetical protein